MPSRVDPDHTPAGFGAEDNHAKVRGHHDLLRQLCVIKHFAIRGATGQSRTGIRRHPDIGDLELQDSKGLRDPPRKILVEQQPESRATIRHRTPRAQAAGLRLSSKSSAARTFATLSR